jgi:hypothetical protein
MLKPIFKVKEVRGTIYARYYFRNCYYQVTIARRRRANGS